MTLRALIAEDEHLARRLLAEYLRCHADITLVAEADNGLDAARAITELKPDLVFLDIQMPKLTGLEVLELTGRRDGVIFTTAYDQHAMRAFELHAVDYLLKPFSQARFDAALERARRLREQPSPGLERLLPKAALTRVLVRDGDGMQVLLVDDIAYIEAQADYVAFHAHGREHLKPQRISELETQLDPARFVRVHRSFIINLAALQGLEKTDSDAFIARMKNGKRIPISRSGYEKLRTEI
ncbi:LytTR family DNA-binding domain-containing protein [Roseateles asaccharophilus]|uniref:Two-component system LytT family response regulator n=1 Tax=Roseateles asaccharophilus TaxID=582607 RepID=A0ABU2AFH4_9BURK|nr:LytTR family DNA-binding domain-containing protein [Roseateles asaccharophilus]MDR7335959.1 two-component system LytT family response regulator [Roseateles asaccharophilus]